MFGDVMDELAVRNGVKERADFARPAAADRKGDLEQGEPEFCGLTRAWNSIQNTTADYRHLPHHLIRLLRIEHARG
jgi:hypothetical protein